MVTHNSCRTLKIRPFKALFQWPMWIVWVALLLVCACRASDHPNLLRVGLSEEPRTLNIWLAGDANSRKVLSQIYQSLYTHDPDTLAIVPWLAADMPHYDSEKQIYTVQLRTDMKWTDGTALTAQDVRAQETRCADNRPEMMTLDKHHHSACFFADQLKNGGGQ